MNPYELKQQISDYLHFHYCDDKYFGVPNFPKNCIDTLIQKVDLSSKHKALDLGCSVGRSSFELAKHFEKVEGIDFSFGFIEKANEIKDNGEIQYSIIDEGSISQERASKLSELNLGEVKNKAFFYQGDACNLKSEFTGYDLVFGGNLIDRLPNPKKFLKDITARINSNGYLVLTSPYTWLEDFTSKDLWPTGRTIDFIKESLESHFSLEQTEDIPFVIRETARKHQYTLAEMSIWKKIS